MATTKIIEKADRLLFLHEFLPSMAVLVHQNGGMRVK